MIAREDCIDCLPGFFAPKEGLEACLPCAGGTSTSGAPFCELCAPGKAPNSAGTGCDQCAAGSVSRRDALSPGCDPCAPGTYASIAQDVCLACWSGRYGRDPGLSNANCSGKCPPGKFSGYRATACEDCNLGYHQSEAGQSECALCDPEDDLTTVSNGADNTNASKTQLGGRLAKLSQNRYIHLFTFRLPH